MDDPPPPRNNWFKKVWPTPSLLGQYPALGKVPFYDHYKTALTCRVTDGKNLRLAKVPKNTCPILDFDAEVNTEK